MEDGLKLLAAAVVAIAIAAALQACQTYRDCRRWGFAPAQCAAFVVHAESKEGWK